MSRLDEIDLEIKRLRKVLAEKKISDNCKSFDEYLNYLEPEISMIDKLDRERRMIMPFELKELNKNAHLMTLREFIIDVKSGFFIDYDGSGNYVKDGMESNISIYPSDVDHKSIRKEFTHVNWYNK